MILIGVFDKHLHFSHIPAISFFSKMSLIKRLPKIELHAHLNGSLSEECIDLLLKAKNDPDLYEERDNLPKNKLDRDTFQISE